MADEKKMVNYPRGMKNEEKAKKADSLMYRGMVFDDHERISSNDHWSQVCKECVDDMPRLVNGIFELPEDCKDDMFKCGVHSCDQPAQYYVDVPYEEMCPQEVEEPEPRRTVEAELNDMLNPLGLMVKKKG